MAVSHLQALATSAPRLRSLDLSEVRLCGRSFTAVATLTALTHLRLGTPHVPVLQDVPCLSQLTRLETLHLDLSGRYELQVCGGCSTSFVSSSTVWLQEIRSALRACVFYGFFLPATWA